MNSRIALATDRAEERGMDEGSGVHGAGLRFQRHESLHATQRAWSASI